MVAAVMMAAAVMVAAMVAAAVVMAPMMVVMATHRMLDNPAVILVMRGAGRVVVGKRGRH